MIALSAGGKEWAVRAARNLNFAMFTLVPLQMFGSVREAPVYLGLGVALFLVVGFLSLLVRKSQVLIPGLMALALNVICA
jgi:hypothetical protein